MNIADKVISPYYSNTVVGLTTPQVIKNLKDAGKSDVEIRQMLIDANKDPTKFGL